MILLAAVLAVTLAETNAASVRIATTVTDRQGRPVAGLTAKDFEVREDGVVQKIDAVEPRTPDKRRIAILLDEFHVDPADTMRVRDALAQFVASLRDGDMALVLKPMDPLTSIRLTSDRDELRHAIATFEGRKGNFTPRTPLEAETLGTAPALVEAGRAQVVLSALRAMTAQLGAAPGRCAILFVTEGFTLEAHRATSRGLPDASIVQRFANRYDVPIYGFDPRAAAAEPDEGSAALARLAMETGGTLSQGADLAVSVARAAGELDSGYTVVYTSAHVSDGRYHPVQVSLPKRAADARARAGFVSLPSEEQRRAMRALLDGTPRTPPRGLRHSPLLNVWSGVTGMQGGEARVAVTWQPAANTRAPARVTLKATTTDGKVLFDGTLAPVLTGQEGRSVVAEFTAPPGRVQLDMNVLGLAGQKIDTDARDLEVPLPKDATPLLLPPVMLAAQSAREFRDFSGNNDAPPLPTREFRRTERLIIRVPAYAAGAPVPVTARLLNRVGQVMKDLDVIPGDPAVTQFDLPLASLAPGDYFLQFTAQGPGGPVSQRVAFKITG